MSFTIPNEADAHDTKQSAPDKVDFDILAAGPMWTGVVSGCAVTQKAAGADMSVDVASGTVAVAGVAASVTGGNYAVTAADGTNPRFDLVVVNSSGTPSVVAGTPAANPVFPAIPANSLVLAALIIAASDTTVETAEIVDKRVFVGPTTTPGNLVPSSDSASDLGSSAPKYWANVYADKVYLNSTATIDGATAGLISITGLLSISGTSSPLLYLTGTQSGSVRLVDFGTNNYVSANSQYAYAIAGALTFYDNAGGYTGLTVRCLSFLGTARSLGTTTFTEVSACRVQINFNKGTSAGTQTVTNAYGFLLTKTSFVGSTATEHIDSYYMMQLNEPASANVDTLYGIRIDDCTLAHGSAPSCRILELGPTPYLRLLGSGSWTAAADETPLYLAEGATPTLRQVKHEATREEFLISRSTAAYFTAVDDWYGQTITSTGEVGFIWKVPPDFVSLNSVNIVMIPDANETIQADVDVSVSALGEHYDNDARQSLNLTKVLSDNISHITEWDLHAADAALFANVAANDYVAIRFQSDTSDLRVIGCRISFEANKYMKLG